MRRSCFFLPKVALLVLASPLVCGGCDSRDDTTIHSSFPKDDRFAREVTGRVRRGDQLVEGALVRISPTEGFHEGESFVATDRATVVTDSFGFFRFTKAPITYDLTIRLGDDVANVRLLRFRGYDAPFSDPMPPLSYTSRIAVAVDPLPTGSSQLAFFAVGDGVYRSAGDLASGLQVQTRLFGQNVTVHAVEYEGDLRTPSAYGSVVVRVSSDVVRTPATIRLSPITASARDITLDATRLDNVTIDPIELGMTYGSHFQIVPIASVRPGGHVTFVPAPHAGYTYRAKASRGAAFSDSGILGVPADQSKLVAPLYEVPVLEAPSNGTFTGHTVGVREHSFVPAGTSSSSRTTVRVASLDDAITLPDVTRVGAKPPSGAYTWTVRAWPLSDQMEHWSGAEQRSFVPSVTSPPVEVVLP